MPKLPLDFKDFKAAPQPPPPLPEDNISSTATLLASDSKLISILSAFLMVQPRGASLAYLVSYVKSIVSEASQTTVYDVLNKYKDIFLCKTTGVGASIEHKWCFVTFESAIG